MAVPVIADVNRVTFEWVSASGAGNAANVMHFSAPGMSPDDIKSLFLTAWDPNCIVPVSGDGRIDQLTIQPLDGVTAKTAYPLPVTADFEGQASSTIPAACALIHLSTGLSGRSNRGRIYLPWVGEDVQATGALDGSNVTACTAAWVAFAGDMATGGAALGVASYKNANWHQAINLYCEGKTATQRRRMSRLR